MTEAELLVGRRRISDEERVAAYLCRTIVDPDTNCWLWQGHTNYAGYGRVKVNRKNVMVHRFVYSVLRSPLSAIEHCHHRCKRRRCVNPDHIEVLAADEHARRHPEATALAVKVSASRQSAKTHCIRGHEFTAANTRIVAGGERRCRACDAIRAREARRRARA